MTEKQLGLFSSLSKSLSKKITNKKKSGNDAEHQACTYLQSNDLVLLEKNFSTKAGEVDLIMRDDKHNDETLVFVEVRYRKNADFGGAAASVTPKKQQRIIKAALAYQQKYAPQSSMRFDVVAIEGDNRELNWIQNAFSGF